jgi:hypothetical protein
MSHFRMQALEIGMIHKMRRYKDRRGGIAGKLSHVLAV